MNNYKTYQLVLILTPFVFSFAIGLDIYIPIVPQMIDIFSASTAMIQLTLSLFLFTAGAGQLFIGPLSDQYGRKATFYLSAAFFALGSLGCVYSNHIVWLLLGRFLSALGACGLLVTSFALVRDMFSAEKSGQMYSYLNGAIGISPTFAPIVGGYLGFYFGWQSIFLFLTGIGLFSLFVIRRFVQETLPPQQRIPMDGSVFKRYVEIFGNKKFRIYTLIAGLAEAVFFCFFSISPFIIIDLHGVPTHQFGYYFAVFGAVIALGGMGSGKLIQAIGIQKMIGLGIALMFIGGISMLMWHSLFSISLAGFLIPMAIACTGGMFVLGGSAAAALEPFGSCAGTASAAFGAIDFSISAIAGSIIMLFPTTTTVPYGIGIVLMSLVSILLFNSREKELVVSQ